MGVFSFFRKKKEENFENIEEDISQDLGDNDFKPAFNEQFNNSRDFNQDFRPSNGFGPNRENGPWTDNKEESKEIVKKLDEVKNKLDEMDKRLQYIEKVAKDSQ
jgi:hypothetical protein